VDARLGELRRGCNVGSAGSACPCPVVDQKLAPSQVSSDREILKTPEEVISTMVKFLLNRLTWGPIGNADNIQIAI